MQRERYNPSFVFFCNEQPSSPKTFFSGDLTLWPMWQLTDSSFCIFPSITGQNPLSSKTQLAVRYTAHCMRPYAQALLSICVQCCSMQPRGYACQTEFFNFFFCCCCSNSSTCFCFVALLFLWLCVAFVFCMPSSSDLLSSGLPQPENVVLTLQVKSALWTYGRTHSPVFIHHCLTCRGCTITWRSWLFCNTLGCIIAFLRLATTS